MGGAAGGEGGASLPASWPEAGPRVGAESSQDRLVLSLARPGQPRAQVGNSRTCSSPLRLTIPSPKTLPPLASPHLISVTRSRAAPSTPPLMQSLLHLLASTVALSLPSSTQAPARRPHCLKLGHTPPGGPSARPSPASHGGREAPLCPTSGCPPLPLSPRPPLPHTRFACPSPLSSSLLSSAQATQG